MANPIIHDGETHREMTDAEYAEWQTLWLDVQAQAATAAAAEAAAASGRTKLAALGLTADEIAALVG